jgi:hypothetical protein
MQKVNKRRQSKHATGGYASWIAADWWTPPHPQAFSVWHTSLIRDSTPNPSLSAFQIPPRVHGTPFNYSLTARAHTHTQHSLSLFWNHEPRRARMHAPLDPYGDAVRAHTHTQPALFSRSSFVASFISTRLLSRRDLLIPATCESTFSVLGITLIQIVPTSPFSTPDIQWPLFHPIYYCSDRTVEIGQRVN